MEAPRAGGGGALSEPAALVAAVDIGGTGTKIGLVAANAVVHRRTKIPTGPGGDPGPLVDGIAAQLRPMLEAAAAGGHGVRGLAVSVAGFLDRERAAMVGNANLPALCGFPLRRALEERLGLECRLEVDSNAAVLADWRYGSGRGAARLLGLALGTGVGGGVVVEGRLLRYTGECAGDLGHVIVDPRGRRCTCGARGCLEAMACSAALSARAGRRGVREIVASARRGEGVAVDALAETGRWLGLGLASLVPLFAPDTIVIGGGIAAADALLLDPARESFRAHAAPDFREVPVLASAFQGWEGIIGAASLFHDPIDEP